VATNIFKETITNFKKAINETGPKLILYSAHDTTIAMMLTALNLVNIKCINDKIFIKYLKL
jgi:hypothetical protein